MWEVCLPQILSLEYKELATQYPRCRLQRMFTWRLEQTMCLAAPFAIYSPLRIASCAQRGTLVSLWRRTQIGEGNASIHSIYSPEVWRTLKIVTYRKELGSSIPGFLGLNWIYLCTQSVYWANGKRALLAIIKLRVLALVTELPIWSLLECVHAPSPSLASRPPYQEMAPEDPTHFGSKRDVLFQVPISRGSIWTPVRREARTCSCDHRGEIITESISRSVLVCVYFVVLWRIDTIWDNWVSDTRFQTQAWWSAAHLAPKTI